MSEPIEVFNNHIVIDGSMGADVTSDVIELDQVTVIAVQNSWTGTPTGILYLQCRNDSSMPWTTVNASNLAGSSGDEMLNVDVAGCKEMRVFYDRTSGSGTLNSFANGKKRS